MTPYLITLAVGLLAFVAGWFVGGHNPHSVSNAQADADAVEAKINELKGKM